MANRSAILMGIIAVLVGVFISLIAADVIKAAESGFNAPRWVVLAAGMVFFLAGATILATGGAQQSQVEEINAVRIFRGAAGFLIVFLFASIANWVAFGSGDRQFSSSIQLPFLAVTREAGDMPGRLAFGCGAVLLDLILVFMILRFIRNLLTEKTNL
jgi:hypothetical protein